MDFVAAKLKVPLNFRQRFLEYSLFDAPPLGGFRQLTRGVLIELCFIATQSFANVTFQ